MRLGPLEFATLGHLVACAVRVEQPCGPFERGKVYSRSVNAGLISRDRRRDFIPFAAQARDDVHS